MLKGIKRVVHEREHDHSLAFLVNVSFQWNLTLKMCQNFHASTLSSKGDFLLDFFLALRSALRINIFETKFALKKLAIQAQWGWRGGAFQTLSCLIRRVCSKTQTFATEWWLYEFRGAYWDVPTLSCGHTTTTRRSKVEETFHSCVTIEWHQQASKQRSAGGGTGGDDLSTKSPQNRLESNTEHQFIRTADWVSRHLHIVLH